MELNHLIELGSVIVTLALAWALLKFKTDSLEEKLREILARQREHCESDATQNDRLTRIETKLEILVNGKRK